MLKIANKYGKKITKRQYDKLFKSGDWYTKPSLTTTFSQALHQKGTNPYCDRAYTIMMNIERSNIEFCV
jgi:hypothetical protein